ncbi:MAG: GNAT family N-acetyltransferase, partial [Bradyrhizobium sp.]
MVGIACYKVEPDQESSAEPAVLVEDNYQGRGVGKQLLSALYQQGVKMGVKSFVSYVHPANHKMLQLIKNCGLPSQSKYADGLTKIQISLNPA